MLAEVQEVEAAEVLCHGPVFPQTHYLQHWMS